MKIAFSNVWKRKHPPWVSPKLEGTHKKRSQVAGHLPPSLLVNLCQDRYPVPDRSSASPFALPVLVFFFQQHWAGCGFHTSHITCRFYAFVPALPWAWTVIVTATSAPLHSIGSPAPSSAPLHRLACDWGSALRALLQEALPDTSPAPYPLD